MGQAAARGSLADATYLDEAQTLYSLLTDGAPAAGYHLRRGFALRDANTRKSIQSSYATEWRPAREVHGDGQEIDRTLNPYVLRQHLLGTYDVAWTAPSWTSLLVFDIDRPEVAGGAGVDAELAADEARDSMLSRLWDCFGFDSEKQPVIITTPGRGYHVYLPLSRGPGATERTWPAAFVRERVEHQLNRHGLDLRPGSLELFPSGIRLRAPCGRGSALVRSLSPNQSDSLRLEPVAATWRDGMVRRDIGANVRAFCAAVETERRPLDEWLASTESRWDSTWGPWGRHEKIQPANLNAEMRCPNIKKKFIGGWGGAPTEGSLLGGGKAPDGGLLFGREFIARIRELSEGGLTEPGQRHDGALKLTWYFAVVLGYSRDQVLLRLGEWLESREHVSATRDRSPVGFVKQTLRECAQYFDTRCVCQQRGGGRGMDTVVLRPLDPVDRDAVLPLVNPAVQKEAEVLLRLLRTQAGDDGRVPGTVSLSSKLLAAHCGERRVTTADGRVRASKLARDELTALGVIVLHTDYSVGNHARLFTCWYQFGSGTLPARVDAGVVLAERKIEEGMLRVLSEEGAIRVELVTGVEMTDADPWWVRMYRRRAFTPAEFFEGDRRKLLPGPFRHRRNAPDVAIRVNSLVSR